MSKHALRAADYLRHISDAIDRTAGYAAAAGSLQNFERNDMAQDAVIRNLEVIGEAAVKLERVAPELLVSSPEIPWVFMRTMRNKVIHDYFEVDVRLVWNTVQQDLPALKQQIQRLLQLQA